MSVIGEKKNFETIVIVRLVNLEPKLRFMLEIRSIPDHWCQLCVLLCGIYKKNMAKMRLMLKFAILLDKKFVKHLTSFLHTRKS